MARKKKHKTKRNAKSETPQNTQKKNAPPPQLLVHKPDPPRGCDLPWKEPYPINYRNVLAYAQEDRTPERRMEMHNRVRGKKSQRNQATGEIHWEKLLTNNAVRKMKSNNQNISETLNS